MTSSVHETMAEEGASQQSALALVAAPLALRRPRPAPTPPAPASSSARCTAAAATPARPTRTTSSSSTTRPAPPISCRGMSVQYRCATGTADPTGVIALNGLGPGARATTWSAGASTAAAAPTLPTAGRHRLDRQPERHRPARLPRQPGHGPDAPPTGDRPAPGRRRRPGRLRHLEHLRGHRRRSPAPSEHQVRGPRRGRRRHRQQRRPTSPAPPDPADARPAAPAAAGPGRAETIEEIQGSGVASPLAGQTVVTTRASSPRRTRPAASTASTSRPPAPAATSTRHATPPPTRVFVVPRQRRRPGVVPGDRRPRAR